MEKMIYHLHNQYGEYDEYTTDKTKILAIYIDEVAQCVENNLGQDEEQTRYAEKWLEKIMYVCGGIVRNDIDENYINTIIDELNKDHYWCIEKHKNI